MSRFCQDGAACLCVMVTALCVGCASLTGGEGEESGETSFKRVSSQTYSLRNDAFEMICRSEADGSFRVVSVTNLRDSVTTVDLQRFGADLYSLVVYPRIRSGREVTAADEALIYLSFDMCVESMNDITTYAGRAMRPESDYDGIPDDFDDAPLFLDFKSVSDTSARRAMTADARAQLVPIRKTCMRNMARSECGRRLRDYGANFWEIPREVFVYQYQSVIGGIRQHSEKEYLKPNFGNLWGILKTNDPELSQYRVGEGIVDEKKQADRSLTKLFAVYWDMLVKVEKALGEVDGAAAKDILHDVADEFGQKDKDLHSNLDTLMVDLPLSIYAKIAIHEIDQAKGLLNDSEGEMSKAMMRFSARTDNGRLMARAKSASAKNICNQLISLARRELDVKDFNTLNSEYFEGCLENEIH